MTDKTLKYTLDELASRHSMQIVAEGSGSPQYAAEIGEGGLAEFYYDNQTNRGIFSIANYKTSDPIDHEIIGWDGKLDVKLNDTFRFKETTITIKIRDKEGHSATHTVGCDWK